MSLFLALGSALYTKLTGGTALTSLLANGTAIYNMQAPDNASLPYVVFSLQGGGPLNVNPSDLRDELYYVRGYAKSASVAGSIDAQISSLLHHGTLAVTGYTTYMINRWNDVQLADNLPSGERIYAIGATYRISLDD